MGNSIAIVGSSPLAEELSRLCREKGFSVEFKAAPGEIQSAPDLIVESSAGPAEEKKRIIGALDAMVAPACPIVASCLRFSTTQIASWAQRPERIVGFATFYPIADKKVIELSAGLKTQEQSLREGEGFFQRLGKETARVREGAGLIFPRILSLLINEAVHTLSERVAAADEIDLAMRLGVNYPSGPLSWADRVGLDEVLAVLEGLQEETGDDRYRAAPLLKRMVQAGWLGEKTGRGFCIGAKP